MDRSAGRTIRNENTPVIPDPFNDPSETFRSLKEGIDAFSKKTSELQKEIKKLQKQIRRL